MVEPGKKKKIDHTYSVIIIGDQAVGKTSFLRVFQTPEQGLQPHSTTLSVDFFTKEFEVDDRKIRL